MIYIIIIKNIYNTLNKLKNPFSKYFYKTHKSHFQNTFTKLKKAIFKILLQNSQKSFSKYFYKTHKSHFQNTFDKLKKVFLDF